MVMSDWVSNYCSRDLLGQLVDDRLIVDDEVWQAWQVWLEDWHGEHAVVGLFDPPEMVGAFCYAYRGTFGSGAQFAEEWAGEVGWDEPKVAGVSVPNAVDWEVVAMWLEENGFSFLELDNGFIVVVYDYFQLS
jgi:hypothetical protein